MFELVFAGKDDKPTSNKWRLGSSCNNSRGASLPSLPNFLDSCCCRDATTLTSTISSVTTRSRVTRVKTTTVVTVTVTKSGKPNHQWGFDWSDKDGKPDGYEWGHDDDGQWDLFGWLKDKFDKRTQSPAPVLPKVQKMKRAPYCPPCPVSADLRPGHGGGNLCCLPATSKTVSTTISSTRTTTVTSTITKTRVSKVTVTATGNSTRLRGRDEVDNEYRDFLSKQTVPNDRVDQKVPKSAKIGIVSFMTQAGKDAYHSLQDYKTIQPFTFYSMKQYANRHGYKVLFHTETSLTEANKQAYWRKMDLILDAFSQGLDYVLYTDLDVLFTDHSIKLESFMYVFVDEANFESVAGKDIVTSNECGADHVSTKQTPRSGFVLLKNSANSIKFLQLWKESFQFYQEVENPEQSAFEALLSTPEWNSDSHIHEWKKFHSYDTCNGVGSFSMHFPGRDKVTRIARAWLRMGDEHLRDYAVGLVRKSMTNFFHEALAKDVLTEEDMVQARNCLLQTRDVGYDMKPYDAAYHAYVKYYLSSSHITNIPSHLYVFGQSEEQLEEWKALNLDLHVHAISVDDNLIGLLMPNVIVDEEVVRWVVLGFLGGFYANAQETPKVIPKVHTDDSMVLQVTQVKPVEFERVLASAAMQPVLVQTLQRFPSQNALTQSMATYICYSFGHMGYTPMDYSQGGHAPGVSVIQAVPQDLAPLPKLALQS
jgi:hypothetical protein